MMWLRKFWERAAAARGIGTLRQLRYGALCIAVAGLVWSGFLIVDTQRRGEAARVRVDRLRHAVSDLRLQVARQHATASTLTPAPSDDDTTADALVARVGEAASRSGMHLAQSRVIASPASAQQAAPSPAPGGATQNTAPAAADPGGVEFHLTGSYAALQRMLKAFGESRSRFQVVTLDVLRAKITEKTGSAQLDIRLICIL